MKIMKQLLDLEMRLIIGKKISSSYLILFISILSLLFSGCKHSIDRELLGVWQINTITDQDGETSIVKTPKRNPE